MTARETMSAVPPNLFWNSAFDSVRYRRADQLIRAAPLARTGAMDAVRRKSRFTQPAR